MELVVTDKTELSKPSAEILADSIIAQAQDNPVDAMVKIKYISTVCDRVKAGIKERFKDVMFCQPQGKLIMYGADIQYQQGYDEPDYDQDAIYSDLKRKLDERKKLLKAAYKTTHQIVDEGTGEVVPKLPTGRIMDDKVNISLKK